MKLISWNVNGLRACCNKGFIEYFMKMDADLFCVQETKMQPEQWEYQFDGYHQYFYSAEKKGYSGTAIFTKEEQCLAESSTYNVLSMLSCVLMDLGILRENSR